MGGSIKKQIALRVREQLAYSLSYCRQDRPEKTKAVVFGQGRTGSKLLMDLIKSSGNFRAYGELLKCKHIEVKHPLQFIRGMAKRHAKQNFIFHFKIYQLTEFRKNPVDPYSFLNTLYQQGFKIIYLKRENVVKQSLSNAIADKRGTHHKFDDKKEDIRVQINCDEFVENVKKRLAYLEAESKILENIEHYPVVYERDLEMSKNHQKTLDGIMQYLALKNSVASTHYRKINQRNMSEIVINYDEFHQHLTDNNWSHFLD